MDNIETLTTCCNILLDLLLKLHKNKKIDKITFEMNAEMKIKFLHDNMHRMNNNEKEKAELLLYEVYNVLNLK